MTAADGWRERPAPLTVTDLVRYAGASGDFNPIHHDPAAAAAFGPGGLLAHGWLSAGLLASALQRRVPALAAGDLTVRFASPLHVGEQLAITGAPADDGIELTLLAGDDRLVAAARFGTVVEPALPDDYERSGERYRWVIEHGAVRDFATAVHAPPAAAGEPPTVPPTFVVTALRWGPARDIVTRIGFDLTRMLNTTNAIHREGAPLAVGETVYVDEGIGGFATKTSRSGSEMRFATAYLDVRDADEVLRLRVAMQMVELEAGR